MSPAIENQAETTPGHRRWTISRSGRRVVVGLMCCLLVVVAGYGVYRHHRLAQDNELKKQFMYFAHHNTDCKQYLQKFGSRSAYRAETQAQLLETDINCATDTRQYSLALQYTNQLEKVYASNAKVYRYINTTYTKKELKSLQAQAGKAQGNPAPVQTPAVPSGGGYDGP